MKKEKKNTELNTGQNMDKKEIRIVTGLAKNRRLKAPDIEGFRAVQEIAKSSLFSILGEKIVGAVCLDLFAGSGNLGIEALSRGAKWCDFVDEEPDSARAIRENVVKCGFEEKSEITRKDSGKFVVNALRNYDVVFIDPFYENVSHKHLLSNLCNILNKDGVVVFFHGENLNLAEQIAGTSLKIVDERKFGKSIFTLLGL